MIDERVRVEGFGDLGRSEKIKWEIMRERERERERESNKILSTNEKVTCVL